MSGLDPDMDLSKVLPDQNLGMEDKVALHASNLLIATLGSIFVKLFVVGYPACGLRVDVLVSSCFEIYIK